MKLLTDKKTPVNEYNFDADGAYGDNNSVKSAETLHGFGQWNHLFSDKFYGYVRVEGLHDGIAGVKYRFTLGPGAGYYLIKDTQTTLATEIGGSYVFEKLGDATRYGLRNPPFRRAFLSTSSRTTGRAPGKPWKSCRRWTTSTTIS